MIPYTDETGLRSYRVPLQMHSPRRWPWLVVSVLCVAMGLYLIALSVAGIH